MPRASKNERRKLLTDMLNSDPFLTDEDIAINLNVSVSTIRLDRACLGIDELRNRVKSVARRNINLVRSISENDITGSITEYVPNKYAVSELVTDDSMVFEKSKMVRGECLYSMAETVAIAVIDASSALVEVANIKYKKPAFKGEELTAKSYIKRRLEDRYIVWVKIYSSKEEIFRGKFILISTDREKYI